jgi:hypothetical protein
MNLIADKNVEWTMHIDLHETTDTDFTEFVPAKAARDGHRLTNDPIPSSIDPLTCPGSTMAAQLFNKWNKNNAEALPYPDIIKGLMNEEINFNSY